MHRAGRGLFEQCPFVWFSNRTPSLSELMQSIVIPDTVLSILQGSSYFILTAILQS